MQGLINVILSQNGNNLSSPCIGSMHKTKTQRKSKRRSQKRSRRASGPRRNISRKIHGGIFGLGGPGPLQKIQDYVTKYNGRVNLGGENDVRQAETTKENIRKEFLAVARDYLDWKRVNVDEPKRVEKQKNVVDAVKAIESTGLKSLVDEVKQIATSIIKDEDETFAESQTIFMTYNPSSSDEPIKSNFKKNLKNAHKMTLPFDNILFNHEWRNVEKYFAMIEAILSYERDKKDNADELKISSLERLKDELKKDINAAFQNEKATKSRVQETLTAFDNKQKQFKDTDTLESLIEMNMYYQGPNYVEVDLQTLKAFFKLMYIDSQDSQSQHIIQETIHKAYEAIETAKGLQVDVRNEKFLLFGVYLKSKCVEYLLNILEDSTEELKEALGVDSCSRESHGGGKKKVKQKRTSKILPYLYKTINARETIPKHLRRDAENPTENMDPRLVKIVYEEFPNIQNTIKVVEEMNPDLESFIENLQKTLCKVQA